MINGMLMRKDQKRVPIGVFPNGSANVTGMNIDIFNIADTFDAIDAGDILEVDTCKVLIDHESDE